MTVGRELWANVLWLAASARAPERVAVSFRTTIETIRVSRPILSPTASEIRYGKVKTKYSRGRMGIARRF